MNDRVGLALVGWLPLGVALFCLLPPRRAVLAAYIGGWLFLPIYGFSLPGVPDYTKLSATALAALLGVIGFDGKRLLSFRPRLLDVPMLVWCACPFASSLSNDLGSYDGFANVVLRCIKWGVPYVLGRVYFADREGLRELAIGIFVGGLLYVPLCLFEIRMSPQLHRMVYGFHQHLFEQTVRFGGYRPTVFLSHGLAVAAWMASASLLGLVLWRWGALRRIWGVPVSWLVAALVVTSLLCKSVNGWAELAGGAAVMVAAARLRWSLPLWLLAMLTPAYLVARSQGLMTTHDVVALTADYLPGDRANSLSFRMENEDLLMEKAFRRPALGWGGWGRSLIRDDDGTDLTVSDGLWIIAFGENGLVGLTSLTLALLLPLLLLLARGAWADSPVALALAVVLSLHLVDNLFNDMFNPLFVVIAGGLLSRGSVEADDYPVIRAGAALP